MKRIALYYRVSTDDETTDAQRCELLDYCARRGWTNPKEYADKISGTKFSRFGLNRLMADVRAHHVDAIVCVKMDRLGQSLPHLAPGHRRARLSCRSLDLHFTGHRHKQRQPSGPASDEYPGLCRRLRKVAYWRTNESRPSCGTQSRDQARQTAIQSGFSRRKVHRDLSKQYV